MYKGFNLKLESTVSLSDEGSYTKMLDENKKKIRVLFEELLLVDGNLDASKLIEEWFPQNEYHVFISHSHKDLDIAEGLANWLYEKFSLKSFIDSHVWGYANDLLKELNDRFAKIDGDLYNYTPAIANAAHVHLMLSTALNEAIDKTECLLFLNTENTLQNIALKDGSEEQRTASPWIMSELKMSSMVTTKLSKDRIVINEGVGLESASNAAPLLYKASMEHLLPLNEDGLKAWLNECAKYSGKFSFLNSMGNKEYDALNVLYKFHL